MKPRLVVGFTAWKVGREQKMSEWGGSVKSSLPRSSFSRVIASFCTWPNCGKSRFSLKPHQITFLPGILYSCTRVDLVYQFLLSRYTKTYGELEITSRAALNREAKALRFIGFPLGLGKKKCKESDAGIRYERSFGLPIVSINDFSWLLKAKQSFKGKYAPKTDYFINFCAEIRKLLPFTFNFFFH